MPPGVVDQKTVSDEVDGIDFLRNMDLNLRVTYENTAHCLIQKAYYVLKELTWVDLHFVLHVRQIHYNMDLIDLNTIQ